MVEKMKALRPLRSCGHPADAVLYWGRPDEQVVLYCLPCLAEKIGLKPCEIISAEEFVERFWKPKQQQ